MQKDGEAKVGKATKEEDLKDTEADIKDKDKTDIKDMEELTDGKAVERAGRAEKDGMHGKTDGKEVERDGQAEEDGMQKGMEAKDSGSTVERTRIRGHQTGRRPQSTCSTAQQDTRRTSWSRQSSTALMSNAAGHRSGTTRTDTTCKVWQSAGGERV